MVTDGGKNLALSSQFASHMLEVKEWGQVSIYEFAEHNQKLLRFASYFLWVALLFLYDNMYHRSSSRVEVITIGIWAMTSVSPILVTEEEIMKATSLPLLETRRGKSKLSHSSTVLQIGKRQTH